MKQDSSENNKIFTPGGQAVIEGVLMRSYLHLAIAVRTSSGKIAIKKGRIHSLAEKHPFLRWPFLRGVLSLIQMMVIGIKALTWSANKAVHEEHEEEIGSGALILALVSSFLVAILLFTLLPYVLTNLIGLREQSSPILFNLLDGVIKLTILVIYIVLISRMEDMKRVFEYHGAEHKAVHCYENKKPLKPAYAKKFSRLHPRCGTSFILLVILIGVLLFSFIPNIAEFFYPGVHDFPAILRYLLFFVLRILFLPIIAAVSYEVLKASAKYQDHVFAHLIITPGLMLQKLTTREPDTKQLEVALAALKAVIDMER